MMFTIYQSLSSERQGIRLLQLHPSESFDGIIRCTLFHAYLEDEPEYEALSYVWGPPNFTQDILVDEKPTKITRNLESALRHLRHASLDRVLWVDALCINQTDIAERNYQVTLMKEIYSKCKRDLAWLGPNPGGVCRKLVEEPTEQPTEETAERVTNEVLERLQRGMRIFRKIYHHDTETLDDMLERWKICNNLRSSDGEDDESKNWVISFADHMALYYLFSSAPLWRRIWVMQELSCARRVLLVAGAESLDWEEVASFLRDENKPYADAFHVTGGHSSLHGAVVKIFGIVQTVQQQRRIMKEVKEGKYVSKLMDVLARFQYADAGDSRDVVYGLLGLVSEKHPIRVDYGKPDRELFTDITKFFIDSTGNLDIICQNPWDVLLEKEEGSQRLPSWVVDFVNHRRFSIFESGLESLLFAQRGIFSAGLPNCAVPSDVSKDGLLKTRGVILDQLGPVHPGGFEEQIQHHPRKWMQIYFRRELLDDDSEIYQPTGEPLFRAFWRTLIMDCICYPMRRLSPEDIEADEKILRKLIASDNPEPKIQWDLASWLMLLRSSNSWLFTMSKTGLLIMTTKQAQENDVLSILDGGRVPCLLRPFHDSNNELRYRMVHSIYIHGYMDGKAATEAEEGRLQKQDIFLA
ncbi:heterokaryon incompatibility protein-domain-containing protein [Xylaria arbuscula]|nr:heterokaryon incompatibility protein-domain-containing protein [Xylaria arbuscula]